MSKCIAESSSISEMGTYWDDDEQVLASGEPGLDFLAPTVFGRELETQTLLESFQSVVTTKNAGIVVVHGESGSGKTSLVDTLRVPVIENGGYFCAGKFFQNAALQEPYSAVMAAFSDICDIVAQSKDFSDSRQMEIRQALDTEADLLRTVISNLASLIGDPLQSADGDIQIFNESSFSKFKVACKAFLKAVSSDKHPLVLFIDDIQWMDNGSRKLIEFFISDNELKNVLLILAYREEEAEMINGLFQNKKQLVDVHLTPLDASAVYEIICTTFRSHQPEQFRELSVLTENRSSGNPFHVREFLAMIQMEGFMSYDDRAETWIFDVDDIRSSVMMRNNLADLLARKIEMVSDNIKETLKVASLIGYHFDDAVVLAASSSLLTGKFESTKTTKSIATSSVSASLMEAVGIGFIERNKDGFQFTHDKIQTSFRELIRTENEVQYIHYIIGEAILHLGDDDDATMYQAVGHFNAAPKAIAHVVDAYSLVQMNLRAAKHCMSKSAFEAASSLLQFGLEVMEPSQRWSEHFFPLSYEMTELLAKAELVIGHFDNCKKATSEALLHATSTEMMIKSLLLDLEARMANHELDEFIPSANRVLLALGFKMPRRVTERQVLLKFLKVKFMMRKMTDGKIRSLPKVDDYFISTAVTVLSNTSALCMMTDDENQAVYSALKACELTLRFGLSPSSSMAFVVYGIVEVTLRHYDEAYRFGRLALELLEASGSKVSICPTVSFALSILTFRKESLRDLKHDLHRAANTGFDIGDIWYGAICKAEALTMDLMLGMSLNQLEDSLRPSLQYVIELGQDAMLLWFRPILQYVLNLQSHPSDWKDVMDLSGEAMKEDEVMFEAKRAKIPALVAHVLFMKLSLAAHFYHFKEANDMCMAIEAFGKLARMSHGQIGFIWCAAFSYYESYLHSKNRKHLRRARYFKKALGTLVSHGCPSAVVFYEFLLALEVSTKSSMPYETLVKSYNHTISIMADENHYHFEGLMNEHAGFSLARRGYISKAMEYFERALYLYQFEWFCNAKYQWLLEKKSELDATEGASTINPHVGNLIVLDSSRNTRANPSEIY